MISENIPSLIAAFAALCITGYLIYDVFMPKWRAWRSTKQSKDPSLVFGTLLNVTFVGGKELELRIWHSAGDSREDISLHGESHQVIPSFMRWMNSSKRQPWIFDGRHRRIYVAHQGLVTHWSVQPIKEDYKKWTRENRPQ